jgi:tripartite ATP-independent transporter DctM subunit
MNSKNAAPSIERPHRWSLRWWHRGFTRTENWTITLALTIMMILPLAEIVARKLFGTSIRGSTTYVQHMTLIVGMLGGAIAAREDRLLRIAIFDTILKGRIREITHLTHSIVAAAITVFLTVAAVQFLSFEREFPKAISYGIEEWMLKVFLPIGFGLVAIRLLWYASEKWLGRAIAFGLMTALVILALYPPMPPENMVWPGLAILLVATLLGGPLFAALGGAALILFWGEYIPIASVAIDHNQLVTNSTLPAVPLFTLAGYFLAEGGTSRRLVRLFQELVGNIRGGPAILVTMVCAFFTSFTGASGVTILALGGLLLPVLIKARYSERTALGLLTGTGSIGLLFFPCLPVFLYAIIAEIDIRKMFLGALIPGILLIVMTAAFGISRAPKDARVGSEFSWKRLLKTAWEAKWELMVPVVAFAGLFSGLATPVETAALTAFYAFVIETFIYRDLRLWRDTPRIMTECGLLVGGVLLILGVALGFTNYLVTAEIPSLAADWVAETIHSPWLFLLLLNLLLIAVGALMDIYSAILIVVPLIIPMSAAFNIDPIHLGVIFLANAELGYLTPPVGVNLFISSLRFNKPITTVFRSAIPMIIVFLIAVLLITYVPALSTTLPGLFDN